MYKIETHLHTPVFSPCGRVAPEEIVRRYHEAGYSGIVVTDHYRLDAFRHAGVDLTKPGDRVHAFLEGYRQVKAFADQVGMMTYYGAEIQFTENHNDYLVYGFSDKLLADPEKVCTMGIVAFSEMARKDGALLIQAHPYRTGCFPVAKCLIDGVEAINRHDVHVNRNDLAMALAESYGMVKTSGGDFHDPEDVCVAGIACNFLPQNTKELADLLRCGQYRLMG